MACSSLSSRPGFWNSTEENFLDTASRTRFKEAIGNMRFESKTRRYRFRRETSFNRKNKCQGRVT